MQRSREDFEALVAASLYEELSAEETSRLHAYFQERPEWRAEAEELQAFVTALPVQPIHFGGDLRPVLHQRIREEGSGGLFGWWSRMLVPTAAGLAVALLAAYTFVSPKAAEEIARVKESEEANIATPVGSAIADAIALVESRAYAAASQKLEAAIAENSEDSMAGEAQRLLADIQFSNLQRYPQAYEAYERLRREFPQTWNSSAECAHRYDLLIEAKAKEFDPLYALDAARNSDNSFAHLEQIVAENPNTTLAYVAIAEMRKTEGLGANGGPMEVAALEMVRQRCTNPLTIAQLNMTLGTRYERELSNIEQAKAHYAAAARVNDSTLASAANEALARLGARSAVAADGNGVTGF